MSISQNINNLIIEAVSVKVSAKNKLKICQEIFKNELVKENIKKFKLSDNVVDMCSTLKINEVRQDDKSLIITVFPKDEKSTTSYLGDHICTIECSFDFSKFYGVSLDG